MDIPSLIVILAMAGLVGWFVSRPFDAPSRGEETPVNQPDSSQFRLAALQTEHARLLNALRELDQDAALGRLPQDDYLAQRNTLLQAGVDILRQLDEIKKEKATIPA